MRQSESAVKTSTIGKLYCRFFTFDFAVLSQAQAQLKQQAVTVTAQPGTLKTLTLPQGTTVSGAGRGRYHLSEG